MLVLLWDQASWRSANAALYSSRWDSTHAANATCWRAVGRSRNTYARLMTPPPRPTGGGRSGAPRTSRNIRLRRRDTTVTTTPWRDLLDERSLCAGHARRGPPLPTPPTLARRRR